MKYLISIVGPTAVGKTALSVTLATTFRSAILSTDSRQMYRFMDIGTAKPTQEEQAGIPHYFLDILFPDEIYSAGKFEAEAETMIQQIFKTSDFIITVGGSTLYIDALWKGIDEMPVIPPEIRNHLNREFQENGLENLLQELQQADPQTFDQIDKANPARVIRALEVFRATGNPISLYRNHSSEKKRDYQLIKIGLTEHRPVLYERINQRVKKMISDGLEQEVRSLLERGYSPENPSLQSIGYQEMVSYIQGKNTLAEAIEQIQQNSRRYAKRQLTWFRRYKDITWFPAGENEAVLRWVNEEIQRRAGME
ncbi:MAG: tRNA (adenosine(37)-N6)-dimethylallyltransferase MiaA [Bacteroidia bacterium]|nr:tRNA (adenosine(37)-N6)-dimethylallyltransferase MiaA [Bacteroidia bacterium]